MSRFSKVVAAVVLLTLVAACGGSATPATSTSPVSSTRPGPVTTTPVGPVVVSPEFIQGAIPGSEVVLLVSQNDETAGVAMVTASAPGATVAVRPSEISGTEVAEVTVVPDATATETELTITIEVATDDTTHTVTRTTPVLTWEDDRAEQAAEILELFTSWLADNRSELGITPETEFEGTFLAPQLLVVSHYGFVNDEWEIGLSWHVMIPPDDFSEIYLRPRSALRPSLAFRVGSWQTALDTGDYQIAEVEPPFEVVR
jgi:hypothetical protein